MKAAVFIKNLIVAFLFISSYAAAQSGYDRTYQLIGISDRLSIKGLWQEAIQIRQQLLMQGPSDQVKAGLLIRIGSDLRYGERYDEAQTALEKGLQLATKINLPKERAQALYQLGDLAYIRWSYFRSDSVDNARQLVNQAIDIFERIKDQAGTSQCLYRLGTILQIKGDGPGSTAAFKRSILLSRQAKDTLGLTRSLTHLAADFEERNLLDSSLLLHRQALALAEAQHNNYGRAHYLNNTGEILLLMNQKEQALEHFQQALFISRELNQNLILCRSFYSLGNFYNKSGDPVSAKRYLEAGLACAQNSRYRNFIEAFKKELNY